MEVGGEAAQEGLHRLTGETEGSEEGWIQAGGSGSQREGGSRGRQRVSWNGV